MDGNSWLKENLKMGRYIERGIYTWPNETNTKENLKMEETWKRNLYVGGWKQKMGEWKDGYWKDE